MNSNHFFFLLFSLFITFTANAQINGFCGTNGDDAIKERLLANKKSFLHSVGLRGNETVYVPITFHMVATTAGQGRIKEYKVLEQLCALNKDYESVGMIFYLKNGTFNYLDHDATYYTPGTTASATKMTLEKNSDGANSVNVFICQNANTPNGIGTTLGYYDPQKDWVVIRIGDVNATSGTLSHELGHFFSLMHTFNGWDGEPWTAAQHGNPVSSQNSPGGVLNELADGSNCENAGDFLCDTPADYNLGFGWNGCTPYTGGCMDINGQLLNPDEPNFMGYFIGCASYHFSNEQINMMLEDYESPFRTYLHSSYIPSEGDITEITTQLYPSNNEDVPFTNVELEWEAVPNADKYLVTVKRLLSEWNYVTTTNKLWLTDLDANKSYSWSVLPFNETGGCGISSGFRSFTTGGSSSAVFSIEGVNNWDVFPNPASSGQSINLHLDMDISMEISVRIIDLQGKEIYSSGKLSFNPGVNNLDLTTDNLQGGIYFMQLKGNEGIVSRKIAIQ
jgi:hypothetical protein